MSKRTLVMITPHGDPLGRTGEPDIGGQCVYIRELSVALAARGGKILAFTRDRSDGKPNREQMGPGADVIRIPCGPRGFVPKEKIRPYLDEFASGLGEHLDGTEIISSHFWDGGYVAGLLQPRNGWIHTSHSLGRRKLASLPDADPSDYIERTTAETHALQDCDSIIASTKLERHDLIELYEADSEKITVIPPGVDAHRFHMIRNKASLKKKLGFSDAPLVMTLGRLDPRKGFDLYFRAASYVLRVLGQNVPVQFLLSAGVNEHDAYESREHDKLTKLIDELAIKEYVRWLPVLEPDVLPLYYQASDLFVMPSRYELFGIVILEAMASGLPVVATRFGGPPEIITDGENGCLVDPTDVESFAMCMANLIRDQKKRERMADKAKKTVDTTYSWTKLAKRHLQLYTDKCRNEV